MESINFKELSLSDIISMANKENADAMNELGIRYDSGIGVEKDEKKAFELYYKASEKNCIKAKFNLAMCYLSGNGTELNENLSFNILKELAEKYNHAKSYYYLGDFYYFGGPVEIDYKKSFYYYNEALKANPNHLRAKFAIALAYYAGKGVERNYENAFNLFEELVKDNYTDAYFYLAELYYLGKSTHQDYELPFDKYIKAFKYFYEALEYDKRKKNIYAAKYYLGEMYMLGRVDEEPNILKGKMYFEDILNENYDDAYYKLALINSGNYGIIKNEEKAEECFNKIEFDLCMSILYYVLASKPNEEQTFNGLFKLLNSEMPVIKQQLSQIFPNDHPAKIYHNRLLSLKREEYDDIIERLKNKLMIHNKDEKKINAMIMSISSENEVIDLAKFIVGYMDSHNHDDNKDSFNKNKSVILKFHRFYCIDDDETGQLIEYDNSDKKFHIKKDMVLNIEGYNCNTKIIVKNIFDNYVELEIYDDNIMTMENMYSGSINVIIEKGKKYEHHFPPSSYDLIIEIT